MPQTDLDKALNEVDQLQDAKQLWLTPDLQKEIKPDYFARLEKDAAAGNVKAQATLGLCFHGGYGVKRDFAKAAEWYQKAAKAGHAGAQNNLGQLYEYGMGAAVDRAKAHELYQQAAQQNLADAQFNLGLEYAQGSNVPQDWQEARRWYEKAAAQGHLSALTNLGNIHLFGKGGPINIELAQKYLQKPADAGVAAAQFSFGSSYLAQKNIAAAATWVRRSAEGGDPGGQLAWSEYLFAGKGGPRDYVKATYWARQALAGFTQTNSKKAPQAHAQLAKILLYQPNETNNAEAFREASTAAQAGNADGQNTLGLCYCRGAGVAKDSSTGFKWYLAAAQQRQPEAATCVGISYSQGLDTPRDFATAVKWFRIGADGGNFLAQYNLGRCYRDGLGVDIDLHEALKWLRLAAPGLPNNRDAQSALAQLEGQLNHTDSEASYKRGIALAQTAKRDGGSMLEAIMALTEAADRGQPFATTTLARMYRLGEDVPKDEARAEELIARIAKSSDAAVLFQIGLSYLPKTTQQPEEKNVDRAIGYFLRSAQQGYGPAVGPLGFCFMTASPEHQDFVAAFEWLSLAASQGDESSRMYLERLRPRLTPAQTTEALQRLNAIRARMNPTPPGVSLVAPPQAGR